MDKTWPSAVFPSPTRCSHLTLTTSHIDIGEVELLLQPSFDMSQATNKYGFTPAEVEYQLTHPDETKGPMIMAVVGTFSALATISVVLRILVRRLNKNGFQGDDYTLFTAFVRIASVWENSIIG